MGQRKEKSGSRRVRAFALVGLFSCFAVTTAFAQQPDSLLHDALRHNWYVRLVGTGTSLGEGRIRDFRADTVVLVSRARIPFSSIQGVDRRVSYGGGWKGGGIFGGLLFAWAGYEFAHGMCESTNCHEIGAALGGGVFGFLLGASLGTMIDAPEHRWEKAWP